jgi:hypothetical protein
MTDLLTVLQEYEFPPACAFRKSALSLLVLRVLADYSDNALSLDNLALFANRFYRRSDLH